MKKYKILRGIQYVDKDGLLKNINAPESLPPELLENETLLARLLAQGRIIMEVKE